jgi:alcohol dehydrogenase
LGEVGRATYGLPNSDIDYGGLFSEEVRVPFADGQLVRVPDGVDPILVSSASDNMTDSYISIKRGFQKNPGARTLVLGGAESFGLFAADQAMAQGAERVDYVDVDEARRAAARRLGCEVMETLPPDIERLYPLVVFASRNIDELVPATKALAVNGHIHILTMFFGTQPVPLREMFLRDASLSIGLPNCKSHIPAVLEQVRCGHVHPERLITVRDWTEVPEALQSSDIKPVIVRPRITAGTTAKCS